MDRAFAYYSIISVLNNLRLTVRELQLLSFIAVRGTITNPAARKDFISSYSTSKYVVSNLISSLKKKGLLVKGNTVKIVPSIAIDFSSSVILQIRLDD